MKLSNLLRFFSFKLVVVLVLIIGAAAYFSWPKSKTAELQFTKVTRGEIKSTVSSSGVLSGKDSVKLQFKTSAKLADLQVKVGELVTVGQYLASLNTQDLAVNLQQAQNNLKDKQAIVDKIYDDLKDHSKDETFTQKQTRTTAEVTRDNAYDEVKAARAAYTNYILYSPLSGVVTQTDAQIGQFVTSGDIIAEVVDWSEVYFDAEVDEADISKVNLNQHVTVSLNSYPDQTFSGTVTEIKSQTKTSSSGSTVVIVRINLGVPAIKLISNLNGQAEIITSEVSGALLVPPEVLIDDNQVLVQKTGQIEKVTVKVGLTSDNQVEILEGLNEGDVVVKNPGDYQQDSE